MSVRYLKEFRKYIKDHNITDVDVLVAFSGDLNDDGEIVSEENECEYWEEGYAVQYSEDGKTSKCVESKGGCIEVDPKDINKCIDIINKYIKVKYN